MPESALLRRTRELYLARPRTVTNKDLAKACGLTVAWLEEFAKGDTQDPGVKKVEALFVYLTGHPLFLDGGN